MITLEQFVYNSREEVLSQHITTEILVDRETLGFDTVEQDMEGKNLNQDFEVPPVIFDGKHLGQILFYSSSSGKKGYWIRILVRTYMEGGRVFYRKLDDNQFVATLKF